MKITAFTPKVGSEICTVRQPRETTIKMLSGRASVSSPILPTRRREPGGESNTGHYSTPALRESGLFQPFCRNHAEKQTRHQEPWVFGEPYESVCRAMLKLRQRLLPYLYTLFEECHRTGAPLLRPLFWAYPEDATAYTAGDEFLCGDALLVAPITRPSAEYRHVYIPAGTWFHFRTGERVEGPAHILP